MKVTSSLIACLFVWMGFQTAAVARTEQCLVLGDSLTKEYEVTFPVLYPRHPTAWEARNWIEILDQRRSRWFDLGSFTAYADPRLIGHRHNWAFPGATVSRIRAELAKTSNRWWTEELRRQIRSEAERVVIFAGGNDVDSYYGFLYNGRPATPYINATRDHLRWLVDYVRAVRPSVPIVLVSVPHVGCAPDVVGAHPFHAVKTGRVTRALDSLNQQLADFARQRRIGFAPGVYEMTKQMLTQPLKIGGRTFQTRADMEARTSFAFSGDGFHPNTCAQAKIAQIILEAFRARYPTVSVPALTDQEILVHVLGLTP